jgi:C_GCAxxG_C_C family probable redox protein
MDDVYERMMELGLQGFGCSQILILLALEAQSKENPDLVRAISGLHGGLGYCGKVCGALSGGCCTIALYAGKGEPDEFEDSSLQPMIRDLVEWFEQECEPQYGGINCADIMQNDPRNRLSRCPKLLLSTFEKVKEILAANNFDLSQTSRPD